MMKMMKMMKMMMKMMEMMKMMKMMMKMMEMMKMTSFRPNNQSKPKSPQRNIDYKIIFLLIILNENVN